MTWVAVLAFADEVRRAIRPVHWLILGLLVAFLAVGAYCSHRGSQGEKDRQAGRGAKTERVASTARETASVERLDDTTSIQAREAERNSDAYTYPDTVPDDRTRLRRCRQLREAGVHVPECG